MVPCASCCLLTSSSRPVHHPSKYLKHKGFAHFFGKERPFRPQVAFQDPFTFPSEPTEPWDLFEADGCAWPHTKLLCRSGYGSLKGNPCNGFLGVCRTNHPHVACTSSLPKELLEVPQSTIPSSMQPKRSSTTSPYSPKRRRVLSIHRRHGCKSSFRCLQPWLPTTYLWKFNCGPPDLPKSHHAAKTPRGPHTVSGNP